MPKFSDVVAGVRARKPIILPLPGAQVDASTGEWLGPVSPLDVIVLREDQYTDVVLKEALAFARKRGLETPEDGDPLYERGKMVHTLAITCIDRDSPKDNPQAFFDGGWEQIHKSEMMTPEVIGYLYLQQQLWQDEVSPLIKGLTPPEFLAAAIKTAGGDMSFFVNSRPGVLWSFARTLASQLLSSLTHSSPSSPLSVQPTETPS
jgi:hypothetical protein